MAEKECTAAVSAAELRAAAVAADEVYEIALELSTLLEAFDDLPDPPKWAFALARYGRRARDKASAVHGMVNRLACRLEEAGRVRAD